MLLSFSFKWNSIRNTHKKTHDFGGDTHLNQQQLYINNDT